MNIYFQTTNIKVTQDEKNFMANRMYVLNKFFSWDTSTYIEIERTRKSYNGHDLYYVSIKIDDPEYQYFAEEYRENVRSAFDHAYGDAFRLVRSHRSKSRNLVRRAGLKIKRLFKRQI
ncbi:MAG: ribosome-associated translation inhibitor RaiA [Crocinitomicaceae bacterium]|jgi:ribosome-associated translation inhibitor RaiA